MDLRSPPHEPAAPTPDLFQTSILCAAGGDECNQRKSLKQSWDPVQVGLELLVEGHVSLCTVSEICSFCLTLWASSLEERSQHWPVAIGHFGGISVSLLHVRYFGATLTLPFVVGSRGRGSHDQRLIPIAVRDLGGVRYDKQSLIQLFELLG